MSTDNVTPIRPGIVGATPIKNPKCPRSKGPSRKQTAEFKAAVEKLSTAQKAELLKRMKAILKRPRLVVDNTREAAGGD